MILRALGLVFLLLLPAAVAHAAGYDEFARIVVVGTVFAFHLGVLARPIAPFGMLVGAIYAAAAVTANFTDGVAALIVAMAAATGAASSLGLHRGLLAVLAAALIGSFEPASSDVVGARALAMFAGSVYGFVLVSTVGRGLAAHTLAVHSKTALTYSVLLAVLVLVAWFTARAAGLSQAWWLPLTVAVLGEPWLESTPGRAVVKLALALAGTLLVLAALDALVDPTLRAACAVGLLLALIMLYRHAWLQAFLLTPALVLLVPDAAAGYASGDYLQATLLAFAIVSVFTVLGKWVLWTLRPDEGHVAA